MATTKIEEYNSGGDKSGFSRISEMFSPISKDRTERSSFSSQFTREELDAWYITGAGIVDMWKRHQYAKPLLMGIYMLWLGLLLYVNIIHQEHASAHIRNELNDHNCTIVDVDQTQTYDCNNIDSSKAYFYYVSYTEVYTRYVNCTVPDTHLHYDRSLLGDASDDYYLQFFLGIVGPILFSYFVVEVSCLAIYDLLNVIPLNNNIVVDPYSWRVGLFSLADVFKPVKSLPKGVGLSFDIWFSLACFQVLFVSLGITLLVQGPAEHCTFISDTNYYAIDIASFVFLGFYGVFWIFLTSRHYYSLLSTNDDLDILIARNKVLFIKRRFRFHNKRNRLSFCSELFNCILIFTFAVLQLALFLLFLALWVAFPIAGAATTVLAGCFCYRQKKKSMKERELSKQNDQELSKVENALGETQGTIEDGGQSVASTNNSSAGVSTGTILSHYAYGVIFTMPNWILQDDIDSNQQRTVAEENNLMDPQAPLIISETLLDAPMPNSSNAVMSARQSHKQHRTDVANIQNPISRNIHG